LWHNLNLSIGAGVLCQPRIDVAGGGGAPLVLCPHPTLTRHQSGDRGGIGEQNLSAIREGDLSFVAADGGDFHGGLPELRSV